MAEHDPEHDRQAIIAAIEDECTAFYERDFDRYAAHWLHSEDTMRMGTDAGGQISLQQGWESESAMMKRIMRDHPTPNMTAGPLVRREKMRVRVSGDMAWVSFDQYTPNTDDVFVNIGLSHQVRVFERDQGRWKIAFAGHGDTKLEYFQCPTVRVDQNSVILWMNDAAKTELTEHPILMKSRDRLSARNQTDNKILHETLAAIADLSPMDVRPSNLGAGSNSTAVPLVLGEEGSDTSHIIWVMHRDNMFLVSFNDRESERQRLSAAKLIFGLSKAQMALAALIVEGNDIVMSAQRMGVTTNTARTHLQRMFDKVGVRSQTALVRRLLSSDAPTV
jgi:DNA-binding CsgD family transcriptional regulator